MENQSVPFHNFRSCGYLTHWERVTHICVSKLTIIGSDKGLSPGRREAIIWTNDGTLLIRHLGTTFSEILIEIHTFPFKNIIRKMAAILSRSQLMTDDAYMHQWTGSSLVQLLDRHLFGAKPLPEMMLTYCELNPWEPILISVSTMH